MTPDQQTALAGWLGDVLGLQGMPEVSQISGGQSNPTYVVAMDGCCRYGRAQDGVAQTATRSVAEGRACG